MPRSNFNVGLADVGRIDVRELILFHQRAALSANTVCEGHAMGVEDYLKPDLNLYEVRDDAQLLAVCGLMKLSSKTGELKTMHTRAEARGAGVGQILLNHVLEEARGLGLTAVYLETGTSPFFEAAVRLYARLGFQDCPPFAAYEANPDSRFMRKSL